MANQYRNPRIPKSLFQVDEDRYSVLVFDDFITHDVEVEGWGKSQAGPGYGDLIANSAQFFINDNYVGKVSTNTLNNVSFSPANFMINKEASTSARTLWVDWARALATFSGESRIG